MTENMQIHSQSLASYSDLTFYDILKFIQFCSSIRFFNIFCKSVFQSAKTSSNPSDHTFSQLHITPTICLMLSFYLFCTIYLFLSLDSRVPSCNNSISFILSSQLVFCLLPFKSSNFACYILNLIS